MGFSWALANVRSCGWCISRTFIRRDTANIWLFRRRSREILARALNNLFLRHWVKVTKIQVAFYCCSHLLGKLHILLDMRKHQYSASTLEKASEFLELSGWVPIVATGWLLCTLHLVVVAPSTLNILKIIDVVVSWLKSRYEPSIDVDEPE